MSFGMWWINSSRTPRSLRLCSPWSCCTQWGWGENTRRQKESKSADVYRPCTPAALRASLSLYNNPNKGALLGPVCRWGYDAQGKWGLVMGPGIEVRTPVLSVMRAAKRHWPQVWIPDWPQDRAQWGKDSRLHGRERTMWWTWARAGCWVSRLLCLCPGTVGMKGSLKMGVCGLVRRGPKRYQADGYNKPHASQNHPPSG